MQVLDPRDSKVYKVGSISLEPSRITDDGWIIYQDGKYIGAARGGEFTASRAIEVDDKLHKRVMEAYEYCKGLSQEFNKVDLY